jgi:AraC-like DNA-binding protein
MPDSITSAFSEPEDYAAALRGEGLLSLVISAGGQFRAKLSQISLSGTRLSAAEEVLPRIAFVSIPSNMLVILFPIGRAAAPVWGGISVGSGELLTLCPGEQFHTRTGGVSHWGSVQFRFHRLMEYGAALTGGSFVLSSGIRHLRPSRADERQLRGLHTAAIRIAAKSPQMLVDNEAARGLEQQLLHAVVDCLSNAVMVGERRGDRGNREVAVCFEQLLRSRNGAKADIREVCLALQVSERRLRLACAAQLGIGPMAYDRLRRLSLAQRALRGDPSATSVSAVARSNGFRGLGRFASNYKAIFGEYPSATLLRKSLQ